LAERDEVEKLEKEKNEKSKKNKKKKKAPVKLITGMTQTKLDDFWQ